MIGINCISRDKNYNINMSESTFAPAETDEACRDSLINLKVFIPGKNRMEEDLKLFVHLNF